MNGQPTTHMTLLEGLSSGTDPSAWKTFCQRYGDLILGFARRRGLQPADCEDVLQEVLIGLSKAMPDFQYDPEKGRFRGYLKTFVVRAIYRRFRQKTAATEQQDTEGALTSASSDEEEQFWEDEWRAYHLRLAMRTIEVEFNAEHRAAFERYALQGQDARETANTLDISVDTVYQVRSRILKRLGELIEGQVREEG